MEPVDNHEPTAKQADLSTTGYALHKTYKLGIAKVMSTIITACFHLKVLADSADIAQKL